jgi:hypothetical protein
MVESSAALSAGWLSTALLRCRQHTAGTYINNATALSIPRPSLTHLLTHTRTNERYVNNLHHNSLTHSLTHPHLVLAAYLRVNYRGLVCTVYAHRLALHPSNALPSAHSTHTPQHCSSSSVHPIFTHTLTAIALTYPLTHPSTYAPTHAITWCLLPVQGSTAVALSALSTHTRTGCRLPGGEIAIAATNTPWLTTRTYRQQQQQQQQQQQKSS